MATPLPSRIIRGAEAFELNRDSWQAAGLVGWWPLGSPMGQVIPDLSGYGNHAKTYKSQNLAWEGKWSAPEGRRGLDTSESVSGSQTYFAKTEFGVITPEACTVSFWHRPQVGANWQVYFHLTTYPSTGSNLYLAGETYYSRSRVEPVWVEEDGSYPSFGYGSNGYIERNGVWMLYTIVRRGSSGAWYCDIYKNGNLFETHGPTSENPPTGNDYGMWFGAYRDNSLNIPSQGHMDDFRLYNRDMGPNEIKAIYLDTKDGSYGDLARPARKLFHFSGTP
ncbi:uncharacterized protein METZ01_LOCUS327051, partial [marine metagenome]